MKWSYDQPMSYPQAGSESSESDDSCAAVGKPRASRISKAFDRPLFRWAMGLPVVCAGAASAWEESGRAQIGQPLVVAGTHATSTVMASLCVVGAGLLCWLVGLGVLVRQRFRARWVIDSFGGLPRGGGPTRSHSSARVCHVRLCQVGRWGCPESHLLSGAGTGGFHKMADSDLNARKRLRREGMRLPRRAGLSSRSAPPCGIFGILVG
jgi:hypothetical protein